MHSIQKVPKGPRYLKGTLRFKVSKRYLKVHGTQKNSPQMWRTSKSRSYLHAGKGAVRLLSRMWRLDICVVTQSSAHCGYWSGAGWRQSTCKMGSCPCWTRWCTQKYCSSTGRAATALLRLYILSLAFAAALFIYYWKMYNCILAAYFLPILICDI